MARRSCSSGSRSCPGCRIAPFILLGLLAAGARLARCARAAARSPTLDEPGAETVRGPRLASLAHCRTLAAATSPISRALAEARATSHAGPASRAAARDRARSTLGADEVALAIDGTPVAWLADDRALRERSARSSSPELIGDRSHGGARRAAAAHAPVLVREVVPRMVSLPVLTEVLRQLAREQVPLDDLAAMLEAIALAPAPQGGFTARDVPALVEHLRGQLRRQISARWAPRGQLAVYTVDAMIEDAVRSAIDRRDGAQVLALEPAIAQDIVAAVRGKLGTDRP